MERKAGHALQTSRRRYTSQQKDQEDRADAIKMGEKKGVPEINIVKQQKAVDIKEHARVKSLHARYF